MHPGSAKGRLVNALKLAAELIGSLPTDRLSPETTEGREGYVHPARIRGTAAEVGGHASSRATTTTRSSRSTSH